MLGALPPAFAGLDDDDALLVSAMLQPLSVEAGEVLMEAGEEDYTLAFITSGTVQLLDGDVRIGGAGARDMLGEVELFGQMPRVANAVASSPVQLQALSYDNWVQLCDSDSAVVHNVERFSHRRLGDRLRWLNEGIAERSKGTAFELHPRGKGLIGRLSGFLGGGGGGRVSSVDRASVLAASPLFDWAQPEIIERIAQSFAVERFDAESMLCKQGEVGDKVFLIAEGSVDVVVFIGKDKAETIATLGPGQAFGDASLASNAPRSASCVSHENVVALTMGRDDYGALFALNDAGGSVFRQAMLKNLIGQLLATQARFVTVARIQANTPDPTDRHTPSSAVWRD
jgi:CRP-like cAMP-binding protein